MSCGFWSLPALAAERRCAKSICIASQPGTQQPCAKGCKQQSKIQSQLRRSVLPKRKSRQQLGERLVLFSITHTWGSTQFVESDESVAIPCLAPNRRGGADGRRDG